MLKLFLSLLALQVFFLSPLVIGNGIAIENRSETTPSSAMNQNPSETDEPKTASLLQQMIFPRNLKGNKEHKEKYSSKRFQEKSPDANNEVEMKAKRDFLSKKDEHEAGGCRKVDMMVNSSDLGLFVSVLYPQNFNAYQCKGKCDLKQRHKFINHSLVKAFLNSKNKSNTTDGTETCCVPVNFRPMSVLYLSDKGSVVKTNLNDVIVEECGCR